MNIFEDLKFMAKPKYAKWSYERMIRSMIENFFFSMFEYKNFPDSLPKNLCERILLYNTCIGTIKLSDADAKRYNNGLFKGNVVAGPSSPADVPDFYGIGTKFILTSGNGYCGTFDPEDIAIGFNNSNYSGMRKFIYFLSSDFCNALASLRSAIKYTKNHPIYKAQDDKERDALNQLWHKIQDDNGESPDLSITSTNVLLESLLENGERVESNRVLNLSQPELANQIQFISKSVDDLLRWSMSLFGQAIQGNGKLAQQTVDEVNGQTSSSFILPNDMLYQRRLWVERMKERGMLPDDATIDFSAAWKVEEIKYRKEAEIENTGDLDEETGDPVGDDTGEAAADEQADPEAEEKKEGDEE